MYVPGIIQVDVLLQVATNVRFNILRWQLYTAWMFKKGGHKRLGQT